MTDDTGRIRLANVEGQIVVYELKVKLNRGALDIWKQRPTSHAFMPGKYPCAIGSHKHPSRLLRAATRYVCNG